MTDPSPLTAAQQQFVAALPPRAAEADSVELLEALGRVAYGDVTAPHDLPPYHRAIVEGFVVHAEDARAASDAACPPFARGEAVEVATGSVLPASPYSIVRMWEARRDGERFAIMRPFPPRFFIEEQGGDLKQGTVVLAAGTRLGVAEIGTLAALGVTRVQVVRRPRVTVYACGDEVVPFDRALRPGLIRDSNTPMLIAAVREAGGEPNAGGIMHDDFDAFVRAAKQALNGADMLVISGGTAAGGRDFISDLVRALGELVVDGVPMRSGRPLIMGVAQGKPIVCVAGHPPEALRGFRLFGVAAMNRLLGRDVPLPEDAPPAQ